MLLILHFCVHNNRQSFILDCSPSSLSSASIHSSKLMADKEPKSRYTGEIQAMMYTFGDVRTPLSSSAQLMEQVVRKQLIELISKAAHVAHDIRGARSIIPEDVIFVVRKDPIKVQRLREFLQWRDLRKQNAKPSDDSASLATADAVEEDLTGITPLDILSMDSTLLSVPSSSNIPITRSPSLTGRRRIERLPWEVIAGMVAETGANTEGLGEGEEFIAEVDAESRDRLRRADIMTREMSREEYMEYAECRQASFTFKKAKKFRDWLNVAQFIDFRLNDDVVELLGFLAWDMVRVVTEKSLALKPHAMGNRRKSAPTKEDARRESRCGLFESALEKTAITAKDIQTVLRQLENAKVNPARMLLPRGRPITSLKLY